MKSTCFLTRHVWNSTEHNVQLTQELLLSPGSCIFLIYKLYFLERKKSTFIQDGSQYSISFKTMQFILHVEHLDSNVSDLYLLYNPPNYNKSSLCNKRISPYLLFKVPYDRGVGLEMLHPWDFMGEYTVWPKDGNVAVLNSKWVFNWLAPHCRLATAFPCSILLSKLTLKFTILEGYNCTVM